MSEFKKGEMVRFIRGDPIRFSSSITIKRGDIFKILDSDNHSFVARLNLPHNHYMYVKHAWIEHAKRLCPFKAKTCP